MDVYYLVRHPTVGNQRSPPHSGRINVVVSGNLPSMANQARNSRGKVGINRNLRTIAKKYAHADGRRIYYFWFRE